MAEVQRFALGRIRGPERPEKWRFELVPLTAPDPSKRRSLAQYITMPQPFDQGNEGSCTANSGCLVAQMCAAIDGNMVPVLSRSWMYYQERLLINTFPQDSGADVIDEFDVDSQDGNIADSVWPYDANPSERPPAAAANATRYKTVAAYQPISANAFRDGILTALDNLQPVAIGFAFFNGWFADYANGVLTQAGMDSVAGGHAVTIKGWAPPSAALPNGGYLCQNSWGATSRAPTQHHPDAKAGDFIFPADLFAMASVGAEADAAVPLASPATLSVAVTGPASATVGQPVAFAATVKGAPSGSVLTYAWDFGDGSFATMSNVMTISHTYQAAGTDAVMCTVTVPTTGATAKSAPVSVTVLGVPTPPPPSGARAIVDKELVREVGVLSALAGDPQYGRYYDYAARVLHEWTQPNVDGLLAGAADHRMSPPPVPR